METTGPLISVGIVSLGACALTEPDCRFPLGGAEVQLFVIAQRLVRQGGFAVTLYVADQGQAGHSVDGIRVEPLARLRPSLRLPGTQLPRILISLIRGSHDVYLTHGASGINGVTWLAARLAGGRHLHMCAHDDESRGLADATLSRAAKWLHHLALRRADALTCQSKKQQDALAFAFNRKATVVPYLPPDPPEEIASARRSGALWVGRDVSWKKPELFLELARRCPEVQFTMVCQPQPQSDIARLARAAPANLRLIPGMAFRETARLFGMHKVLVSTSEAEGYPTVFLQAGTAGTPVVSLCVDPDGLLSSNKAGFACHGSFEELVRRTVELLTNPALWEEAHEGALRLSREAAAAGDRVVGLFRSLAASGERRGGLKAGG